MPKLNKCTMAKPKPKTNIMTVTTAHMCLRITVHNCHTQHSTEQF